MNDSVGRGRSLQIKGGLATLFQAVAMIEGTARGPAAGAAKVKNAERKSSLPQGNDD